MKVNIQSIHFDADIKLIDFIQERVQKLNHFHDGITLAEVILRVEKDANALNKLVELKVHVSGHDLFSKRNCATFEEATDQAIDAVMRQLIKHKEKDRRN